MFDQDTLLARIGPVALARATLPRSRWLPRPIPFVAQHPARSVWQVPHRTP